jgi:hypothetical protein
LNHQQVLPGLDIQEVAAAGNEILLKVEYEYSFFGTTEKVECQEYKWDNSKMEWSIT